METAPSALPLDGKHSAEELGLAPQGVLRGPAEGHRPSMVVSIFFPGMRLVSMEIGCGAGAARAPGGGGWRLLG